MKSENLLILSRNLRKNQKYYEKKYRSIKGDQQNIQTG